MTRPTTAIDWTKYPQLKSAVDCLMNDQGLAVRDDYDLTARAVTRGTRMTLDQLKSWLAANVHGADDMLRLTCGDDQDTEWPARQHKDSERVRTAIDNMYCTLFTDDNEY